MNLKVVKDAEGDHREIVWPTSEGDVLKIAALLDALGVTDEALQFTCYVQVDDGEDEEVWVRAHNDKMLNVLILHYAGRQDILVVFRRSDSPSPTSLPLKVAEAGGGGSKSSVLGGRASYRGCTDNDIEPFTQKPMSTFDRKDLVYLPVDDDRWIAVSWKGLYTFAKLQLAETTSIFKIKLCATLRDGSPAELVLTKKIWLTWITRGSHSGADTMHDFFGSCFEIISLREQSLHDLHNNAKLWSKLKIFTADLLRMSNSGDAAERLTSRTAPFYLSSVYFADDEVSLLLSFPTACGLSFQELLEAVIEKKLQGSGRGEGLCSSHDLAPVFQTVFDIRKNFEKEKAFEKEYKAFEKIWKKAVKQG